jgi:hypothetical protein
LERLCAAGAIDPVAVWRSLRERMEAWEPVVHATSQIADNTFTLTIDAPPRGARGPLQRDLPGLFRRRSATHSALSAARAASDRRCRR